MGGIPSHLSVTMSSTAPKVETVAGIRSKQGKKLDVQQYASKVLSSSIASNNTYSIKQKLGYAI